MKEKQIEEEIVNTPSRMKFANMLQYIREGLSEEDAIILADFTTKEYTEMLKKVPTTKVKIKKANIAFKHSLLKQVTRTANDGEPKLSQWLLEKKFGHEFNQKAADPNKENSDDLLLSAIKDIQKDKNSTEFVGIKKTITKIQNDRR